MITSVTELKIRKYKLSTILTATNSLMDIPVEKQLETIGKWADSASRVILHSTEKPSFHKGLRLNQTTDSNMTVLKLLRSYVVQIPGSEIFAIAAPNVLILPDQQALFEHVEKQKMERSWAAYAKVGLEDTPKVFIMSAPVLPYVLRDLPPTLTFATDEWAKWVHNWMGKFMLKHRYFNAAPFGIVAPVEMPVVPAVVAEIPLVEAEVAQVVIQTPEGAQKPAFEVIEPVSLTQPTKKKPGRPKKLPLL